MLRRTLSLTACAGLAALAACNALTETSGGGTPVGIVILNARTKGAGFTTSPVMNFYKAQNITFSSASVATDSCVQALYSPNQASTSGTAQVIGGGAFVVASVSGR